MAATTHHKNGQRGENAVSGLAAESAASNIRTMSHSSRKPAFRAQSDDKATPAELHMIPTVKTKKTASGPSEKVVSALIDEGDPAMKLAELRDVLFGPTRKLQEARLEELVAILEQVDREAQATQQNFAEQFSKADAVDRQLAADLFGTNQHIEEMAKQHERDLSEANVRLHALADRMKQEILHAAEIHKRALEEQADGFSSKLDKLSSLVFRQMEEMSEHQKLAAHVMSHDFATQLGELDAATKALEAATRASDDRIRAEIDARVMQLEGNAEDEKRRSLKVLTEGLSSLSERLQSL
jgi:hypothetical protein